MFFMLHFEPEDISCLCVSDISCKWLVALEAKEYSHGAASSEVKIHSFCVRAAQHYSNRERECETSHTHTHTGGGGGMLRRHHKWMWFSLKISRTQRKYSRYRVGCGTAARGGRLQSKRLAVWSQLHTLGKLCPTRNQRPSLCDITTGSRGRCPLSRCYRVLFTLGSQVCG